MIKDNRGTCTVHTFGIGNGVSTELVKDCAKAGQGHYSFINNLDEIEKKVMQSLQKDFLEYLIIMNASILGENHNSVATVNYLDDLSHGQPLNLMGFVPSDASLFSIDIYDPNTKETYS